MRRKQFFGASVVVGVLAVTMTAAAAPGDLDPTFGGDGIVVEGTATDGRRAFDGALTPDGKVVIVGREPTGPDSFDFRLVRLDADGSLDASFGGDGIVTRNFLPYDVARAAAVQPDGKVVLAGESQITLPPLPGQIGVQRVDFGVLLRFNEDGSLDDTFGLGNGLHFQFGGIDPNNTVDTGWFAMALQPDGKIITAGSFLVNGGPEIFLVSRFTANGILDETFGDDGNQTIDGIAARATSIAVQPDGKILVGGDIDDAQSDPMFVARFDDDGTLDTGFGDAGTFTFDGPDVDLSDVAVQADGAVIMAGFSYGANGGQVVLVRLDEGGDPDPSFGEDGVFISEVGSNYVEALALQADGGILGAGTVGDDVMGVVRYLPDGSVDTTFGDDGAVGTIPDGFAEYVGVQDDGKIVLVGEAGSQGAYAFVAARLEGRPAGVCDGEPVTVDLASGDVPTEGDDVILGTRGADRINGLGGADRICGLGGRDRISGGAGDDQIMGQNGRDRLRGGAGADWLFGGRGKDLLVGGPDEDNCTGGPGADTLRRCEDGSARR